jgi:hypothetical protein
MPIYLSGFILPTSKSIPFILEDVYLRGGFRVVADLETRDTMKSAARKTGCLVYVESEDTIFQYNGGWQTFDITKYVSIASPLEFAVDETTGKQTLTVAQDRILPTSPETGTHVLVRTDEGITWVESNAVGGGSGLPDTTSAEPGMSLVLDAQKNPIWGRILPPITEVTPERSSLIIENGQPKWGQPVTSSARKATNFDFGVVTASATKQASFTIESSTIMILALELTAPDVLIEIHNTNAFEDTNPYSFLSSGVKLSDDGVTYDSEGQEIPSRRYAFYTDADDGREIHVSVTNNSTIDQTVGVNLTYVSME